MEKRTYHLFKDVQDRHWWFVGRRQIIASVLEASIQSQAGLAGNSGALRILDVGCGTGAMLPLLNQFGEVWGVDNAPEAVQICRSQNFSNVYQTTDLPLEDDFLDMLTFFDVIEHVPDDADFVRSYLKYLKKDGLVVITVPALQLLWSDHDVVNHHYRRYSKTQLARLLQILDLQVLKMTYFNTILFAPILGIRLLQKFKRKLVPANITEMHSDFERPHQASDRLLSRVFGFERHFLKKYNFPIGVSLLCIAKK